MGLDGPIIPGKSHQTDVTKKGFAASKYGGETGKVNPSELIEISTCFFFLAMSFNNGRPFAGWESKSSANSSHVITDWMSLTKVWLLFQSVGHLT